MLVVGVAYKADIDDVRESPALDILERLQRMMARVQYHDPFVTSLRSEGFDLNSVELTDERLKAADLVLITTAHSSVDHERIAALAPLVLDTRNVLGGNPAPSVRRL